MAARFEQVRRSLPISDNAFVEAAISAVEQLPGLDTWTPTPNLSWLNVIRWGTAILVTEPLRGVAAAKSALADEIRRLGRPEPSTWAELSGAALCVGLGADAGERLGRQSDRTADWRLTWQSSQEVDFEVTSAAQKPEYVRRQNAVHQLSNELFKLDRSTDLIVHILDPTNAADRNDVEQACRRPNGSWVMDRNGHWLVRSEEVHRVPGLFPAEMDPPPEWWPRNQATGWMVHSEIPGPDTVTAAPWVRINFGIPFGAYINPVQKKADAPQGRPGSPFLISVDVSGLPGAFRALPDQIRNYLKQWASVSGILLFHDVTTTNAIGWQCLLISNPHGRVQLPVPLLDQERMFPSSFAWMMTYRDAETHMRSGSVQGVGADLSIQQHS